LGSLFRTISMILAKKANNSTCTLAWGSRADILSTVLWFVCACMAIYSKYPTSKQVDDPDDSQNHMAEVNLTNTTQSQAVAEANAADMEASEEYVRANAELI
jgi:hypothetical protein